MILYITDIFIIDNGSTERNMSAWLSGGGGVGSAGEGLAVKSRLYKYNAIYFSFSFTGNVPFYYFF